MVTVMAVGWRLIIVFVWMKRRVVSVVDVDKVPIDTDP